MEDSLVASWIDKAQIVELVCRFGVAIDQRNWEQFHALFADSVEFDYSSIGDVASVLSPDEIVENAKGLFKGFQATQHVITNHQTEVSDDTATCLSYIRAMHILPNDEGEPWFEIGGYYNSNLMRVDAAWKIKSWKFSVYWSRGNDRLFELGKKNA